MPIQERYRFALMPGMSMNAWAIKKVVLRFGGPARYQYSQYFFMGLIMGEALCNGLWLVIDYFTGKIGNRLFILG